MKKFIRSIAFFLLVTTVSCQMDDPFDPGEPIIEPPARILISRDTISSGSYLGMGINEEAGKIYTAVQAIQQAKLNVVSNVSSDITQLGARIPLYDYILLDENRGTDSGVQITLEDGHIKAIFLNSGKRLAQWPVILSGIAPVRIGDSGASLFQKLVKIRNSNSFNTKFEHIMLLTKNMATLFDPVMAQSPQWYFAHNTAPDISEEVRLYFKNGKLDHIEIDRFKFQI